MRKLEVHSSGPRGFASRCNHSRAVFPRTCQFPHRSPPPLLPANQSLTIAPLHCCVQSTTRRRRIAHRLIASSVCWWRAPSRQASALRCTLGGCQRAALQHQTWHRELSTESMHLLPDRHHFLRCRQSGNEILEHLVSGFPLENIISHIIFVGERIARPPIVGELYIIIVQYRPLNTL